MSGMIDGWLVWIDTQWGHTAVWLTDPVWTVSDIEPFSGVVSIWMSTIEVGRPPWQRRRRWWHANTMRDELHISDVFTLYDEALCRMRQYLRCQSVDRQPATPDIINCVVIRRCNFTEGRVCILKWYCMCSIRMRWCSVSVLACGAFNDLDRWAVTDYLARTERMIIYMHHPPWRHFRSSNMHYILVSFVLKGLWMVGWCE